MLLLCLETLLYFLTPGPVPSSPCEVSVTPLIKRHPDVSAILSTGGKSPRYSQTPARLGNLSTNLDDSDWTNTLYLSPQQSGLADSSFTEDITMSAVMLKEDDPGEAASFSMFPEFLQSYLRHSSSAIFDLIEEYETICEEQVETGLLGITVCASVEGQDNMNHKFTPLIKRHPDVSAILSTGGKSPRYSQTPARLGNLSTNLDDSDWTNTLYLSPQQSGLVDSSFTEDVTMSAVMLKEDDPGEAASFSMFPEFLQSYLRHSSSAIFDLIEEYETICEEQLLPVCDSWEDTVWAYFRVLVDTLVEQEICSSGTALHQLEELPREYLEANWTLERVFEELQATEKKRVLEETKEHYHVIQKFIILGDLDGLMEEFSDWLSHGKPALPSHLLRFMTHLILFFRSLGMQTKEEVSMDVLKTYIQVLVSKKHTDLIAFYVSHLPADMAIAQYSEFLECVTETDQRKHCLELAKEAGLDVAAVTKTVVENIRKRDADDFSHHDLALDSGTSEEQFNRYERAIYAALSGNIKQLLPVCDSWEDTVWAYFRVLVDTLVEQEICSSGTALHQLEELPREYLEANWTLERVFEELQATEKKRVLEETKEHYHVIQKFIILGDLDGLMEEFSDWLSHGKPALPSHLLRFMTHLILFFRSLGMQTKVLVSKKHTDLIAFYVSHLPADMAIAQYSEFLECVTETDQRKHCLELAKEAGLDVAAVTKTVVENIRKRDADDFSHHDLALDSGTSEVQDE
ncbi:UNVERIFIED_CONTAM: hypothetical protein FKN15_014707 [Acipenser sinensis]